MHPTSLRADCLAIATHTRETIWVRSNPSDVAALVESFSALSALPEYQSKVLYPLLSYVDDDGDEQLVELWAGVMTGLRDALRTGTLSPTIQVELWHETEPKFGLGPKPSTLHTVDFTHVANLRVHGDPGFLESDRSTQDFALDQAYSASQNLSCGWHPRGARSTSVGDVLVLVTPTGRKAYRVDSFGFCAVAFVD